MRYQLQDGTEAPARTVGAAVVRAVARDVYLDLGPADGPPLLTLQLSHDEAGQLMSALKSVTESGGEAVLIVSD